MVTSKFNHLQKFPSQRDPQLIFSQYLYSRTSLSVCWLLPTYITISINLSQCRQKTVNLHEEIVTPFQLACSFQERMLNHTQKHLDNSLENRVPINIIVSLLKLKCILFHKGSISDPNMTTICFDKSMDNPLEVQCE